jgi:hypothetical protein
LPIARIVAVIALTDGPVGGLGLVHQHQVKLAQLGQPLVRPENGQAAA